jgi:hypothetical protein
MRRFLSVLALLLMTACGSAEPANTTSSQPPTISPSSPAAGGAGCADVVAATIESAGSEFTISATVSSADTGWDKYADLWEVRTQDGKVIGERVLAHPHVNEQPFTRSLSGVAIPDGESQIVIAARDSVAGFCGATFTLDVVRR